MIFLYLVNLIRTLLVFALIYLLIRWLSRLMNPNASRTQQANSNWSEDRDGETTIRYNKKGEKIINKDEGEYVDFEEVE